MNQLFIDVSGRMYVENSEHEPKILTEFREGKMIFLWWREEGSLASSCWILPISQRGMEPWVLACGLSPGIGERGVGVGLDGQCSIFCTFMGLPFWPGCLSLQSQLQWERGAGRVGVGNIPWVGSLDLRLLLVQLGKKPLVSRIRFDYSSLTVLSLLAGGLFRVGTFWHPTLSLDLHTR